MFKQLTLMATLVFILSACTYVNPSKVDSDQDSVTNSQQSTQMQQDQKLTDEEQIRLNMYENPYEYFKRRDVDDTLDNSDSRPHVSEEASDRIEQERQLYYRIMQLDEIRQAGISYQDDHIYVAVNLKTRTSEPEAIESVTEVVENVTGRTDVTVYVDREFHNRIEDRKY
ncbi:YhcN/YlaJ family sporulation lipoprotein [Alkalibacillus silvisoli]|uniref:Sporulation protein n=1 Tax=Alkalibacillus silvisoli TaxID=392823 RepID=A0ABN0ZS11_9BACI